MNAVKSEPDEEQRAFSSPTRTRGSHSREEAFANRDVHMEEFFALDIGRFRWDFS